MAIINDTKVKKILYILFAMMLTVSCGEKISNSNADIRMVGTSYNGDSIYSWIAPNGQSLYFAAPGEASIQFEDVNFDGHEDVVIYIIRAASNFFTEFFKRNRS